MMVNRYAEYLREVDYLSRREGERIRDSGCRILEEEGILEV